jgi:hypothetical protein
VWGEYLPSQISANDAETIFWINYYQLNAVLIGHSSRTYNCHGYAWFKSEDIGTYFVIYSQRDMYINDSSWSNDGQSSYITVSESQATHSCYTQVDHSVRKIQNSYPVPISGERDYVSKWGDLGLVQHAKNHDMYYLKNNLGHNFKILKTNHSGTLSSYPKTWIGAGGKDSHNYW